MQQIDFWPGAPGARRLEVAMRNPLAEGVVHTVLQDRRLLAIRFARHAGNETQGAGMIATVGEGLPAGRLREDLLAHALDEARHGRMFQALARQANERRARPILRAMPRSDASGEAFDGDVAAFLAATHVAELRNLHLLDLYLTAPVRLAGGFDAKVRAVLGRVQADEHRHVSYTWRHVQGFLAEGRLTNDYMEACFAEFERLAWWEIASIARDAAETVVADAPVAPGVDPAPLIAALHAGGDAASKDFLGLVDLGQAVDAVTGDRACRFWSELARLAELRVHEPVLESAA
jgi:hypothetical protein